MRTRAAEMQRYHAERDTWLRQTMNAICSACGLRSVTDLHHKRGRIKGLLLDKRFWIPVCRDCHDWIHQHPKLARSYGLLATASEWNTVPR